MAIHAVIKAVYIISLTRAKGVEESQAETMTENEYDDMVDCSFSVVQSALIFRANEIYGDGMGYSLCKLCRRYPHEVEYNINGDKIKCGNTGCSIKDQVYSVSDWETLMKVPVKDNNAPYITEREIERAVPRDPFGPPQDFKMNLDIRGNAPAKTHAGPQYAWLVISPTMRSALRKDGASYIRDAGGWAVEFKNVNSRLMSISSVMLRNDKELVPCSSEEYVRDNGKFAKGICK